MPRSKTTAKYFDQMGLFGFEEFELFNVKDVKDWVLCTE